MLLIPITTDDDESLREKKNVKYKIKNLSNNIKRSLSEVQLFVEGMQKIQEREKQLGILNSIVAEIAKFSEDFFNRGIESIYEK